MDQQQPRTCEYQLQLEAVPGLLHTLCPQKKTVQPYIEGSHCSENLNCKFLSYVSIVLQTDINLFWERKKLQPPIFKAEIQQHMLLWPVMYHSILSIIIWL